MSSFDIVAFRLPNCPAGEFRFEEPRDIQGVTVRFRTRVPPKLEIRYLQRTWPSVRFELRSEGEDPAGFGWIAADDQWNGVWRKAAVEKSTRGLVVGMAFRPLSTEGFPDIKGDYDVTFRRTLGLRLEGVDPAEVQGVQITTRSETARTTVRIHLDAGSATRGRKMDLSAYNARVELVTPGPGVKPARGLRAERAGGGVALSLSRQGARRLDVTLLHMTPAHAHSGDDTHLTVALEHETFTIRVQDLETTGPVWYAEEGVYVTRADRDIPFETYRAEHASARTVIQEISAAPEQSFAGAFHGQPRAHASNFSLGCPRSPQRFWLEANGDLMLHRGNLDFWGKRPDLARRFLNAGSARFFFGLGTWIACARFDDPSTGPVYTMRFRKGDLFVEQEILCAPLMRPIGRGPLAYDEPTAALARFRFRNSGDRPVQARLPIGYSQDSARARSALERSTGQDDTRVPRSTRDPVKIAAGSITTAFRGRQVLRAAYATSGMRPVVTSQGTAAFEQVVKPGESCEVRLSVPYVAPVSAAERSALRRLDFDRCRRELAAYWRAFNRGGSQLTTPVPHLDAVHAAHLAHVEAADIAMPDDPELVNTSVGSSTYGNFANESCMILQELDQRGLADEVRRRLQVFVKYAGTAKQPGNFTDFDGSFYGAGGWECGDYNQHHGWALWYLAEHFLLTRERAWFSGVAGAVVAGADWVFRQRRGTRGRLPHSRGWESGFLPAGSLEDVTDFDYWLSTNSVTWRGTDAAARALEALGHPEAARVRAESDSYRADLVRGLETNRQHAPLVPLRNGRWVPHYPSRLYCRGRDSGWIRELLEGAVYLLISGLYGAESKQAGWILNDLQDNLYNSPPYGFVMRDPAANLRNRGGFSIQPNLLAGLMPHLERDEIEVYLWMFFNAWVSCFREEISGMIEHPMPELGFDNSTGFKTSDEANAVMWLRAMMVYSTPDLLHLGRAVPRAWLDGGEEVDIRGVRTHHGTVSARWVSDPAHARVVLEANLQGPQDAPRVLARFRHPGKAPIQSVTVNGKTWTRFEPRKGDVDITGLKGKIRVIARYKSRGAQRRGVRQTGES